jgi:hypothetical protein
MGMLQTMRDIKDTKRPVGLEHRGSGQAQIIRANVAKYRSIHRIDPPVLACVAPLSSAQTAVAAGDELLAPIAGVTVDQYVHVCKGVAAYNYDQSMLPIVAARLGIAADAWAMAAAGFNARVSNSPAFARHFNALYRGC